MAPALERRLSMGHEASLWLSAEARRPLYAYFLVSGLCALLLGSAIARGEALTLEFRSAAPLSTAVEVDDGDVTSHNANNSGDSAGRIPVALQVAPIRGVVAQASSGSAFESGPLSKFRSNRLRSDRTGGSIRPQSGQVRLPLRVRQEHRLR